MKLIEPSVEILEQSSGLDGIYKQIEIAGRTCYKSEENMTETSAKDFVDRMVVSKHYAMLEHGTVYLRIPRLRDMERTWDFYKRNKYSVCKQTQELDSHFTVQLIVTTNYRVLVENNRLDDLRYLCEATHFHEKRITSKFICDRGVSHEIVRHRVFSFAQESTRYCNYSKDKFGNALTFIRPSGIEDGTSFNMHADVYKYLFHCEYLYFSLLNQGWKPQKARAILPNCLKTEIVMTGFESDYNHFFELRCAKSAHPDMQVLANQLKTLIDEKTK